MSGTFNDIDVPPTLVSFAVDIAKEKDIITLNLTIPSGMALVRVCYVAIRKSKTCSGSFGIRAGTLSKICYIKLLE